MTFPDGLHAAAWLDSSAPEAEFLIAGVPSSAGSPAGSQVHLTPVRLRHVLERFSTFHAEAELDLTNLPVHDLGDWPIGGMSIADAATEIERRAASLDHTLVHSFVGGDGAITRPLVGGFGLAGMGLLALDSRLDVTARNGAHPAEQTIRLLIDDGLPGDHIAGVGIHGFGSSAADREYCDEQGIASFPMDTVDLWGIEEAVTVALDQVARDAEWIYVTVDLAVMDVAFAPACRTSLPGGLTPRQLATAAQLCGRHPLVRAADFVGVDPQRDRDDLTMLNLANVFLAFAAGVAGRPEPDE